MHAKATRRARRFTLSTTALSAGLSAGALVASVLLPSTAHAQSAGTVQRALPNVLLLVDNSGSMERMSDSSMPSDKAASKCVPGTQTDPNRWGMLVQALTGNLQPYFSCGEMSRAANGALANEYRIGGKVPYDTDYFMPHHRILSGNSATAACAVTPWRLPGGAGKGVGPSNETSTDLPDGSYADGFPSDALRTMKYQTLLSQYAGAAGGSSVPNTSTNACEFLQASDGQLDAARDYVRFGLMTFDNDTDQSVGVTPNSLTGPMTVATDPFLGQWSYLRSTPFSYGTNYGMGRPAGCPTDSPFEVGARNWGAPPWEGRLVRFSDPFASLADIQRTNDQIQQVLVSSRPYGATPIDGMLDDARDYLWNNPNGPSGTTNGDPYVRGYCRKQYIILLTDGAPNLNLRTTCAGTGGRCPYEGSSSGGATGTKQSIAWDIANSLYTDTNRSVPVYVIGFSVNGTNAPSGDGFPAGFQSAPNNNCSTWFYSTAAGGFGGNSAAMSTSCRTTPPTPGTTADACCQLNEIAYFGSGGTAPPFFAESQRDLANAFGRVLANITKTATTRTVPAYSSVMTSGTTNTTASFTAAFIPNPRKPWSGQIERSRQTCVGGLPAPAIPDPSDQFDVDVAKQSSDGNRQFITVRGDTTTGSAIDSARSMRPFVTTVTDGIPRYQGTELGVRNSDPVPVPPEALSIDDSTCKRSRDLAGDIIPSLGKSDCSKVIWGFASVKPGPTTLAGYSKWNVRCSTYTNTSHCAVNGSTTCNTDADCSVISPGDVCVPDCAALGAVFRSSPAAVSPPIALSRDEGYRDFAQGRRSRKHALFVATTDGVLHAFNALETGAPAKQELWSFIPPAVLPRLASNYPTGQQILLDGSPIVKDVVWDRTRADLSGGTAAKAWHTTLVAGMGTNGPGYYALNVSDVDCANGATTDCVANYQAPSYGVKAEAAFADQASGSAKRGPHFLWQLTDVEAATGEALTVTRTSSADNKNFVSMFGKQTGTPAITTLYFDPTNSGTPREIGVAILPGGIDGPADKTGTCQRGLNSTYSTSTFPDLSDSSYPRRSSVRLWGKNCAAPVAGRSVTVVRLDTGEVIRHFSRVSDAPKSLQAASKVADTPFDSPIVGFPIVYPSDVGVATQKVFIGDADGTMWRIDLTDTDPTKWKALLFQDLFSTGFGSNTATDGRPISVPPIASLDQTGNVVLNVSTGDQENLIASSEHNMVVSLVEGRPQLSLSNTVQASVKWYTRLENGERVTGPMAVFDSTLYFATYLPEPVTNVCGDNSKQFVWGVDFVAPQDAGILSGGGRYKFPNGGSFVQKQDMNLSPPSLIPGVAVKQTLNCVEATGVPVTDFFGMSHTGVNTQSGTNYTLDIPTAKPSTNGSRGVEMKSVSLPKPRTPTIIDSWALVVD